MRILLFGKNGQVGYELTKRLAHIHDLTALGREPLEGLEGDLTKLDGIRATIRSLRPELIINAAAYTAVDKAESNRELARVVNATASGLMADEAARLGAHFVHFSTDYVFNGEGLAPWRESDPPGPLSVYGHSKLEGEKLIGASGCQHHIFRTSWVYGVHGNNFIKTILRLAAERSSMRIVDDQIGAPTGADLIADAVLHVVGDGRQTRIDQSPGGVFHLAAADDVSWCQYAKFIVARAREQGWRLSLEPSAIEAIPSSEYPTPAERPKNSRLDTIAFQNTFGFRLPSWEVGVIDTISKLLR